MITNINRDGFWHDHSVATLGFTGQANNADAPRVVNPGTLFETRATARFGYRIASTTNIPTAHHLAAGLAMAHDMIDVAIPYRVKTRGCTQSKDCNVAVAVSTCLSSANLADANGTITIEETVIGLGTDQWDFDEIIKVPPPTNSDDIIMFSVMLINNTGAQLTGVRPTGLLQVQPLHFGDGQAMQAKYA